LADGRTLVAADCADEIYPARDGSTLRAVWRRWSVVGGKAGELADIDLTSEVKWRFDGQALLREETLQSKKAINVRRWWLAIPTTAATAETTFKSGQRWDQMRFAGWKLAIAVTADWPLSVSLKANGDDSLGKGARGPIPLQLVYETKDLVLTPRKAAQWSLRLNAGD
jgi:hypothetical protein